MFGYFFNNFFGRGIVSVYLICSFFGGCRQDSIGKPGSAASTPTNIPQGGYTEAEIDQLKKRIENFDEPISYCQFLDLQTEGKINQRQADELINFAYGHYNPVLYRPAAMAIAPEQYSLNLLWLSPTAVDENYPITGKEEKQLQENILKPLSDWQSKQPEANINFWYDGTMVKKGSVERTKTSLRQIGFDLEKLTFRNLRDTLAVQSNPDLFVESIPVYFRVDLAKAIIIDHVFKVDKVPYVATIDADVAAITRGQFFDKRTLEALNSHGYIFGTAFTQEENSFVLLYNNHAIDIVKMHERDVLNSAIAIAKKKLDEGQPIAPQMVYHRYLDFRVFVNRIRGPWNTKLGYGKNMIFPPSQFGGGGYSDHQITALKKALVGHNGCPHGS